MSELKSLLLEFLGRSPQNVQGVAVEGSHLHGLNHAQSDIDVTVFLSSEENLGEIRSLAREMGVEV